MPNLPPTPDEEHKQMPGKPESEPENELTVNPVLQRAEDAERKRDEYFVLLRQSQADYENAHQRNRREQEQSRRFAAKALAFDLLPVIDNLERALAAAQDNSPLAKGVALVHGQILDALKRHGITRMEALHRPFDPHLHEALLQIPSGEHPAGTILQVDQPGFMIHDQVLRPARVIISAAPLSTPNAG
jgi:molecular chaperone GrpE